VGARPVDEVRILPVTVTDLPGADHTIWKFSFGYGLIVAMVLSAVVMTALFVGIDRVVYRKLRRRKSGIVIFSIAALGLAISLRSLVLVFYGPDPRLYTPGIRTRISLSFDVHILADQLFIFGAAIAVTVAVYLILYRTTLGKAMRAMADNPDLARVSGINTERIIMWTWLVAGALVAVAGVLLALQAQLDPQIGFVLLLPLFAAAILVGIGSPQGAFVGGMISTSARRAGSDEKTLSARACAPKNGRGRPSLHRCPQQAHLQVKSALSSFSEQSVLARNTRGQPFDVVCRLIFVEGQAPCHRAGQVAGLLAKHCASRP
jgi:branched-subunit amino acid ABC-type transport system permease component